MAKTNFPNIDFRFRRGCLSALRNTSVLNGTLNFTNDTRELFVDMDDRRVKISDIVLSTEPEIRSLPDPENKLYIAVDSFKLLYFDFKSLSWKVVGSNDVNHSSDADFAICDAEGNIINKHYISIDDSNQRDSELQDQIDDILYIIGDIERFDTIIINDYSELPIIGTKGTIYFVKENSYDLDPITHTSKYYGEYIWIESTGEVGLPGYYEKIGITTVDLSNYYTKQEVNDLITNLGNTMNENFSELNNRMNQHVSALVDTINNTNSALTETDTKLTLMINSLNETLTAYINDADYGDEG